MTFIKNFNQFGKTIIDDSVAGNVQGFKNFKIWPFLQILSFKMFFFSHAGSMRYTETPHIAKKGLTFSYIQCEILTAVILVKLFTLKNGMIKMLKFKNLKSNSSL